ncbi:MAG: S8 family serine peptidase [Candidatus Eiseniibacteriota bacterium]
MTRLPLVLKLLRLAGTATLSLATALPAAGDEPPHATDHLLVRLRPETLSRAVLPAHEESAPAIGVPALDVALPSLGVQSLERLLPSGPARNRARASAAGLDRWCIARLAPGADFDAARKALAERPELDIVEPDYIGHGSGSAGGAPVVPNDPSFGTQWFFRNLTSPGADNHATEGWARTTGSATVTVAILDSGIDWDHPDLDSRIWTNVFEIPANGVDDDVNGYIDDVRGWDFVSNDNDPMDDHGHGTNVAGIAGAESNNGIGVAGTDWSCRLMAAKNLNSSNSGLYSWWTASIVYAVDNGARVLNMSEGGTGYSASMESAVDYAHSLGAIVCVAMMNGNSATPYYPAAFVNPIAVGATNASDDRAVPFCWGGGSSYGAHIELCAPGELIYSTLWNNTYGYFCGTSQATPQVTGALSLGWALAPTLTNSELRALLLASCDDQVGLPIEDTFGFDSYYGHGRLNLDRFLASVSLIAVEPSPLAGVGALRPPDVSPNPVSASARLRYVLPAAGRIALTLHDVAGRRVRSFVETSAPAGEGTVSFDGATLAPGAYYARLEFQPAGGGSPLHASRRLAIVR